jgi:hypothetical protein
MKPKVVLIKNNVFVKEWCVVCGNCFGAGDILPELYDQEGQLLGYLCDDCAYEPQNYTSKLVERAEALEKEAAQLRQMAEIGVCPPDKTLADAKGRGQSVTNKNLASFSTWLRNNIFD